MLTPDYKISEISYGRKGKGFRPYIRPPLWTALAAEGFRT
jgi:hypothetical protein